MPQFSSYIPYNIDRTPINHRTSLFTRKMIFPERPSAKPPKPQIPLKNPQTIPTNDDKKKKKNPISALLERCEDYIPTFTII